MPKPRILPNVILGLLNNKKHLSGRNIENEFQTEIGEFWQAAHSQIYPELRRMLVDGWIRVAKPDSSDRHDHKVINYEMTEFGKQHLLAWLSETVTAENDYLSSLKLYFIHSRSDPSLQRILQSERHLHTDKLAHLKKRLAQLFADKQSIEANYGHYLILTRAIEREQNHVKWLVRVDPEYKKSK